MLLTEDNHLLGGLPPEHVPVFKLDLAVLERLEYGEHHAGAPAHIVFGEGRASRAGQGRAIGGLAGLQGVLDLLVEGGTRRLHKHHVRGDLPGGHLRVAATVAAAVAALAVAVALGGSCAGEDSLN